MFKKFVQKKKVCAQFSFPKSKKPGENSSGRPEVTHLICARLKYDLYDFFRGCFGPASFLFLA